MLPNFRFLQTLRKGLVCHREVTPLVAYEAKQQPALGDVVDVTMLFGIIEQSGSNRRCIIQPVFEQRDRRPRCQLIRKQGKLISIAPRSVME